MVKLTDIVNVHGSITMLRCHCLKGWKIADVAYKVPSANSSNSSNLSALLLRCSLEAACISMYAVSADELGWIN